MEAEIFVGASLTIGIDTSSGLASLRHPQTSHFYVEETDRLQAATTTTDWFVNISLLSDIIQIINFSSFAAYEQSSVGS